MPNQPILSFNSGELSPLIDARTDTEKYSSGCRHLDNFFPRIYGAAERRQGTHYIATQYDSTVQTIREISFVYSSTVSYALEFGDQYIIPRSIVTDNGERVYDKGSEVFQTLSAVTSPYLAADLFDLHIKQLGDTMWITHGNYPQYKLQRTSQSSFTLTEIEYNNGPFLLRNDLINPDEDEAAYMVLDGTVSFGDTTTPSAIGSTTYGVNWSCQTILSPYNATISSVWLYLQKWDGLPTPRDVTVSVYATTSDDPDVGVPTGSILATSTLAGASIPDAGAPAWTEFTLDSSVTFTSYKLYAIVMSCPDGTGATSDCTKWSKCSDPADAPIVGHAGSSNNGGSAWELASYDFGLKFVSQAVTSPVVGFFGTMSCVQDDGATAVNFFEEGHLGSLFKLTYPRVDKVSEGQMLVSYGVNYVICAAIDVKGTMRFNTSGRWRGTIELQRNENGAGWETIETWVSENNWNAAYSRVEDADNVQYRAIVIEYTSGDPRLRANITVSSSTQDCIVRVTAINSTSNVDIEILSGSGTTDVTRRWAEGCWSPLRGYPVSITFFEDRCCFVGMRDIQTQVLYDNAPPHTEPKLPKAWLSHSGDYEDFEVGVKDADSFDVTIPSANDAKWIESLEALVVGTSGDEWRIGSNKMQQPISPTNYSVRQQSAYGSNGVQPIIINDQLLFTDYVGRKLRELAFDGDKYRAIDLTALAEHITKSGIVGMAYQRNPDPIIWCVLNDGNLVAMIYEKQQNCIAWFKIPIDGEVQSVCVMPGIDQDDVWLSIKRNIGGTDYVYNEKLGSRLFDYIEDAYFVDCGVTYTTSSIVTSDGNNVTYEGRLVRVGDTFSTISGLDHLNGEIVKVLADGEELDDATVSGGSVSLKLDGTTVYAMKASVGKGYRSKLQPMRLVTGTPYGSSQGIITRVPKMSISFLNSMDVEYGAKDSDLKTINWDDSAWENSEDSITGTFTGEITVSVDGGFSVQNPIIILTDAPLPCVVRSIMPRLEVTGS